MPYDAGNLSVDKLTRTEKQVAVYLLNGMSRAEIARELKVTENTVKAHTRSVYRKTEVKNQKLFMNKYLK